jgi:drug/metabolite transporter (DMT)-like permease
MWGSSFLLIDIGVEHYSPELVALLRVAFGAVTLALVPAARRRLPRTEWPAIALLGFVWMAAPFVLLGIAQESIDSSLAGMLNGAAPLFTAIVAGLVVRALPSRQRAAGLAIGLAGVVAISRPSVQGADASVSGVVLVLLATVFYGVAFNLAAPLQRRHGALAVIWRAQLFALVMLAPFGLATASGSDFTWPSLLAVAALGCFGTAVAYVAFTTLVGRVGSTRASVTIYLVPAVAIVLGAAFRDETIAAISLVGTVLVTAGAYLTSRADTGGR